MLIWVLIVTSSCHNDVHEAILKVTKEVQAELEKLKSKA
jgi:ribosome-associated translation inhibitor RaiA